MRKNKVKEILKSGGTVISGWLHIPNTWTAEVMANAGYDTVAVDMQHGLMNIETAMQMMQVIGTTDAIPLARCNWNEPGSIMKLLDSGAYGIICPMVNTKEEWVIINKLTAICCNVLLRLSYMFNKSLD